MSCIGMCQVFLNDITCVFVVQFDGQLSRKFFFSWHIYLNYDCKSVLCATEIKYDIVQQVHDIRVLDFKVYTSLV